MKTSVRIALGISLIWIIIDLIAFLSGFAPEFFVPGILLSLLLLLVAISLGLFLTRREAKFAETSFVEDFKTSAQSGLIYAILISIFVYCYHEFIDPSIKNSLVEARIEKIHEIVPNEAAFVKIQEENTQWKGKSYDDYIENQELTIRGIISSFSVFIFHLAGLFIFTMFFSFFGTIIMRKVILR